MIIIEQLTVTLPLLSFDLSICQAFANAAT